MKKIMLLTIAFLSIASLFNTTAKADDLSEFKAEAGIVDNKFDKKQTSQIKKAIKYGFKNSNGKFVSLEKKFLFNTTGSVHEFDDKSNDELSEEDFFLNVISDSRYAKAIDKVLKFKGKKGKKPVIEFNLLDNTLVDALYVNSRKRTMTYYSNGTPEFTANAARVYTWGNIPMARPATTRVANNEFVANIKDPIKGDKLSFIQTYINRWGSLNEVSFDYDSGCIISDSSYKFFNLDGKKDEDGNKITRDRGYYVHIMLNEDSINKVANETSPFHYIVVE